MGARPSSFRKGGGFLNDVDGLIVDYQFTDDAFPDAKKKPGKKDFNALHSILSVQQDGAAEPVTTTLFVGSADDFEISEDGHTLTPAVDGANISANSDWGRLINSMVDAGFDENELPEDEIDFSAIVNWRMRFKQEMNAEKTKKLGKQKGKDGKEYDRKDLIVTAVYDKVEGKAAGKGKAGAKAAPAAKGAKGKAKGNDVSDVASEALLAYLEANGGELPKAKLRMKVLTDKRFKGDNDTRDAVIKWLYEDDNLEGVEGVAYDPKDKAQMVSLAAE